ncbi:MAG: nitroreductase family protein [Anaerolineaceae bacterium]|jgi:nitroreductase|nr:nitroreductase family protein [Anaerolineaceae bacterium]
MSLKALVRQSRSYRRFDEKVMVSGEVLRELIGLAEYAPTGSNQQPLKFWLSNTPEMNAVIFPNLAWAGALKDWKGPAEGERPAAYILILGNTEIRQNFGVDHGIAAQTIMLGAAEQGLGGCMIASVRRESLRKALDIPERYEILLVLALGRPAETVVTEPVGEDGNITYYRDAEDVHHVPKRGLDELILHDVK